MDSSQAPNGTLLSRNKIAVTVGGVVLTVLAVFGLQTGGEEGCGVQPTFEVDVDVSAEGSGDGSGEAPDVDEALEPDPAPEPSLGSGDGSGAGS